MRNKLMQRFFVMAIAMWFTLPPTFSWAIDESTAKKIAEDAAGCGPAKLCQTRARLEKEQWIVIVSFVLGYRENNEPIFAPGGFVGFTIDQDGKIVDKMPGV